MAFGDVSHVDDTSNTEAFQVFDLYITRSHVQHTILASYSTVISLIIRSNNCVISKILILSILTFDHYLLPFQLMYSSNTLISVIPSMY